MRQSRRGRGALTGVHMQQGGQQSYSLITQCQCTCKGSDRKDLSQAVNGKKREEKQTQRAQNNSPIAGRQFIR